jgi:hypothetical protein
MHLGRSLYHNVIRTVEYDLKHGVTKDEVISFLVTLKTEASFAQLRMVKKVIL